jgi:predicted transcriptional regulator
MKTAPSIAPGEMDILRFVTDHHPVTVREVADHVAQTKGHTRTTALNVMERLRQKGFLVRRKVDGIFHYSPRVSKPDLLRSLVRNFVESALGGSVSPFMAYLTEEAKLGDAERRELRRLAADLKSKDTEA